MTMDAGFQTASFTQSYPGKGGSRFSDLEFGNEIASGIVFSSGFHKFDDLKNLLECNKDAAKLDAMRRIIGMIARGRDCSELFPSVVKNVVSKDPEVRKLVYAFLTRYAEEQQDVALLSISSFQRALKDPNPMIRASALRVLSSFRIPMLLPIILLAIQSAIRDVSPYVRKLAAHAIVKVQAMASGEEEQLVSMVETLLADKTTLVIGDAVHAFEKICPDRFDLIHPNYRRICSLLLDVDEWGQAVIIDMLTRYARTQFPEPRKTPSDVAAGQCENPQNDEDAKTSHPEVPLCMPREQETSTADVLESDRNMLLGPCRMLLRSRNSAVVLACTQLFFAMNSQTDFPNAVRALVRLLNEGQEVKYVVLANIASLCVNHPGLFEPYQGSFYIQAAEPIQCKLLKLEILTRLITETNYSTILREFQYYASSSNHELVVATIQAIGRCASTVRQITDVCLSGIVRLMTRADETVVAECVVALRKLLQTQVTDHKEIITRIAQLIDTMTVPSALASILWLVGEFSHRVPRIAPDVLRKMAKVFPDQAPMVKLQVLTLAAKLCIVNPKQTRLLAQYVFDLARYDQDYDIRDRSRMLRALLFAESLNNPSGDTTRNVAGLGYLTKHVREIFLASKPAPVLQSEFEDRSAFRWATLSYLLNRRLPGYRDLPEWPTVPPNPWSRVIQEDEPVVSEAASSIAVPSNSKPVSPAHVPLSLEEFFAETDEESENDGEEENNEAYLNLDEEDPSRSDDIRTPSEDTDASLSSLELTFNLLAKHTNKLPEPEIEPVTTEPSDTEETSFSSTAALQLGLEQGDEDKSTAGLDGEEDMFESFLIGKRETKNAPSCTATDLPGSHSSTEHLLLSTSGDEVCGTSSVSLPSFSSGLTLGNTSPSICLYSSSVTLDSSLGLLPVVGTPTPLPATMGDVSSDTMVTGTTSVEPNESLAQRNTSLRWIQARPNSTHPFLRLAFQYTRSTWSHQPKMVILKLLFSNDHAHLSPKHLSVDLTATAMGRLLMDAKRVESFDPIDCLEPGTEQTRLFGIDFAGYTDPIELSLTYELDTVYEWSVTVVPPAGELIRPLALREASFFVNRGKLAKLNAMSEFALKHIQSDRGPSSQDLSDLCDLLTLHANFSYRFCKYHQDVETAPEHSEQYFGTAYFAAQTIGDHQMCLLELVVPLKQEPLKPDDLSSYLTAVEQDGVVVRLLCNHQRYRCVLSAEISQALQSLTES